MLTLRTYSNEIGCNTSHVKLLPKTLEYTRILNYTNRIAGCLILKEWNAYCARIIT